MLRYKLRTLFIVVGLLGLVCARIAYLKRMSDYHRAEGEKLMDAMALTDEEGRPIRYRIHIYSHGGTGLTAYSDGAEVPVPSYDRDMSYPEARQWQAAMSHQTTAHKYERAMYRPWMKVSNEN